MWQTLRPQIMTLLQSLKDGNGHAIFAEISKYPKIRFNGYPSAHIVPSDNTGDYDTNMENIRTYSFNVRVFYETKNSGIEGAIEGMEGLLDQVIDAFDEEDLKGADTRTIGINAPTRYTFINVFATPNKWGEYPDEEVIMAELTVKVRFTVDITS